MATTKLEFPDSVFAWRRRRDILPLECFDFPRARVRADFDKAIIGSLTGPRMAGHSYKMTPYEIRDLVRSGDLNKQQKCYMYEVFEQCDGLNIRLFRHCCGASLYELARTMIACRIRHPFVAEWLNCRAPGHEPPPNEQRMYRLHCNLGR
ncbi:MAG: hypothetical protein F4W90_04915 [Gammaproteobacteria bacterium]|nr:hypothetical protein [Gammaproteobacteria bacterium]